MVIQITTDIDKWANTPADIELRQGDLITIPKRPGFVLVTGQVYNATALAFVPDRTAGWYLSRAGGANGHLLLLRFADGSGDAEIYLAPAQGQ